VFHKKINQIAINMISVGLQRDFDRDSSAANCPNPLKQLHKIIDWPEGWLPSVEHYIDFGRLT
jgi:uncharacterized protein (UPF0128 family)